jgi:AcrR family transcriptional regulator
MGERKEDRRVGKTRRQLRHGLAQLMRVKRVQDITVRELTDLCDLNRGTFYIHYKDVFDMVDRIENELIDSFGQVLNQFTSNEVIEHPGRFFTQIFELMRDNNDIVSVLVGPNGDLKFINQIKQLVRERCVTSWPEIFGGKGEQHSDYFSGFIVSGFVGLFEAWFQKGMAETPEEMAALAEGMVLLSGRITRPRQA